MTRHNIYLTRDLFRKAQRLAEIDGRSASYVIGRLLDMWLNGEIDINKTK